MKFKKDTAKLHKYFGSLRELNQALERNGTKLLIPWTKAKKELGLI